MQTHLSAEQTIGPTGGPVIGAAVGTTAMKNPSAVTQPVPHYRYIALLLLFAAGYHWLLCFLQTFGISASPARVSIAELLIYLACLPLLRERISARAIITVLLMAGTIVFLAFFRDGYVDVKGIRDLLIPILFIWVGRTWKGTVDDLDRMLRALIILIVAIGLFEIIFFDTYTHFINSFTYYIHLGGIQAADAQISGQTVTLNGLRPEGIGRTVLPQLLGSHRASSLFLEPVSFGNFAVVIMAWGLSKPFKQWQSILFFCASAVIMIALADSRFALYSICGLLLLRLCVHHRAHLLAITFPLLGILLLLLVATYSPAGGDNLHGRLTSSGLRLLHFDIASLLGLNSYAINFGDMGYAYVISRLGIPIAVIMWLALFMLQLPSEQANRYRTFACMYIASIMCISGTSAFALKTAAVLWFLFGALSVLKLESETAIVQKPTLVFRK